MNGHGFSTGKFIAIPALAAGRHQHCFDGRCSIRQATRYIQQKNAATK